MNQVPHVVSELGEYAGFIEYGGKPAIFEHTNLGLNGYADLWVLEDGAKWSTKSLVLQPCQKHLLNNSIPLIVQCTTQNGKVILVPFSGLGSPTYIFYYDLSKVEIKGMPEGLINWSCSLKLMDKSESIMHLEI
ncbi:F-box protein [Cardamine amara subsp. amara]|uniref:F-box protein n=1 Tax=Cardamine amara subsp. amara TaxID=228776 RepID=A0ABD1ABM7_CARAN